MTDVIIIGAGGNGAEIDEYIAHSERAKGIREYLVVGFLDDNPGSYSRYKLSAPLSGSISEHIIRKDIRYIIGIANPEFRRPVVEKFLKGGAEFVTFIHDSAYVSPSAVVGKGCVIGPNANIGPNVCMGDFNLLNSRCSLGHDTRLGCYNFISPNVCLSGFTEAGDENLFGINSATIPGIKIGNRNKIAAGMVLNQNIKDDSVVFYRYKEQVLAVPLSKGRDV